MSASWHAAPARPATTQVSHCAMSRPRMAAGEAIGTLSTHILSLEAQCQAGESSACVMIDQISGYAQALKDLNERRTRAPDAPIITDERSDPADDALRKTRFTFDAAAAEDPNSVTGALVKLFKAYDREGVGEVSLSKLTSRWVASRTDGSSLYMPSSGGGPLEWEARQARAGSRRMHRLFAASATGNGGKVSLDEFVGTLVNEYEKRMERGLSQSRAIAEISTNMPQNAIFAEMYGSE
uniref:EF-hand domain-containing protein n=1 Tax=Haptolina brevifila TaxID=156173 RepID=A0A7S2MRC5_9EUKA